MARRLMTYFVVAFGVLAALAPHGGAQTGDPQATLETFLAAEQRIGALLQRAEAERMSGNCREFARLSRDADGLLRSNPPDRIGATGHARLSARVATSLGLPCPATGSAARSGALLPQDATAARQQLAEVIEGAFADAEAARLAGDCTRWNRQLDYLERTVGPQGQYGLPRARTFPESTKLVWRRMLRQLRARACTPAKPHESPSDERLDSTVTTVRQMDAEIIAELTEVEGEVEALLAEAEGFRLRGACSSFNSSILKARDLWSSQRARNFSPPVRYRVSMRIKAARERPCPPPPEAAPTPPPAPSPPPAPMRSLGDLRVALAKACGAQFEPARAALIARIDQEILTTAGDPKRLAALVEDRAYIAGLPVKPCPPPPPSPLMTGNFITNFGTMVLVEGRGTYSEKNGRVTPTRIDGLSLEASWEQSESARRCGDGSYRGKLTFNFSQSGFWGYWGYCDEKPSNAWSGQRR